MSSFQPTRVFWQGDPGFLESRGPIKTSGFNILLSSADGIAAQATQAARFIRKHKQDLLLLRSLGFSASTIDFGVYDLATDDRPWPSYRIPHQVVALAGELGCSIALSFYGVPPDAP